MEWSVQKGGSLSPEEAASIKLQAWWRGRRAWTRVIELLRADHQVRHGPHTDTRTPVYAYSSSINVFLSFTSPCFSGIFFFSSRDYREYGTLKTSFTITITSRLERAIGSLLSSRYTPPHTCFAILYSMLLLC